MEEKKSNDEQKRCSLCSQVVSKFVTFPLGYKDKKFSPMSNQVFGSKKCVRRYLIMKRETHLQTLFSLFCIEILHSKSFNVAPDPQMLVCRQISPHATLSINFSQFCKSVQNGASNSGKQCSLCFKWFSHQPKTYVTKQEYGLFKFANVALCSDPCVARFIKPFEPYSHELFQEYRFSVHGDTEYVGLAPDAVQLLSQQIVAEPNGLTQELFATSFQLPRFGLSDPELNRQYFVTRF